MDGSPVTSQRSSRARDRRGAHACPDDSATRPPRSSSRRGACSTSPSRRSAPASTRSGPATTSSPGATPTATPPTRWSGWARPPMATQRVTLGTRVLTPSFRYNPAVVAQAFATLGCLAPGRVDPRRRDRRVDERGPGGRRLARAERALRPAQGGGRADPGAHRSGRGDRRLRGHVLPDPRRDGLRQA